jgi:hypothetical protein
MLFRHLCVTVNTSTCTAGRRSIQCGEGWLGLGMQAHAEARIAHNFGRKECDHALTCVAHVVGVRAPILALGVRRAPPTDVEMSLKSNQDRAFRAARCEHSHRDTSKRCPAMHACSGWPLRGKQNKHEHYSYGCLLRRRCGKCRRVLLERRMPDITRRTMDTTWTTSTQGNTAGSAGLPHGHLQGSCA